MRTKKIMQSLAVMLLLVLAGCKDTSQSYPVDLNSSLDTDRPSLQAGQQEQLSQMKTNQADCLLLYYPDTLQGLEEHCTYIVRGTVLDGSEQKTIQEDPQDFPYIYTETLLRINEVYQGDLSEGSIVPICEKYYVKQTEGEDVLVHYGNYMPCEVGKEYIFFLVDSANRSDSEEPSYSLTFLDRSRYPVLPEESGLSTQNFRAAEADEAAYQKLYQEVAAKYLDLQVE